MQASREDGNRSRGEKGQRRIPPCPFSPLPLFPSLLACWLSGHLAVAPGASAAGPGYLPTVGPPALRFAPPPPPPPAVPAPLPPLAVIEPRPVLPPPEPSPPLAESTNTTVEPMFLDPFAVPPVAEAIATPLTNVIVLLPPEPPTFAPQMFMRYFIGGATNAAGVSILSPVGFVPPLPPPPSSSATFQTVPSAKP